MLRNVQRQVSKIFLKILPEVVNKLNCVGARNACWFTMATLDDGTDSQMMLRIVRESKMTKLQAYLDIDMAIESRW